MAMTKAEKALAVVDLVRAVLPDGRTENETGDDVLKVLQTMDTSPIDIIVTLATFTSSLAETLAEISGMTPAEYISTISVNIALADAVGMAEEDPEP